MCSKMAYRRENLLNLLQFASISATASSESKASSEVGLDSLDWFVKVPGITWTCLAPTRHTGNIFLTACTTQYKTWISSECRVCCGLFCTVWLCLEPIRFPCLCQVGHVAGSTYWFRNNIPIRQILGLRLGLKQHVIY